MGFFSWVLFGLLAGAVAKLLTPGDDKGGCLLTIILGVAGAAVGGWIGTQLGFGTVTGFNLGSFGLAVLGSVILLVIFRLIRKR
jgi:uncharacterized membrane protein YeaQ/YmgE (transglycosylase-associated protein family)